MENKINIAELLKDCPKGMKLDCVLFDDVTLELCTVDTIYIRLNNGEDLALTEYGRLIEFPTGKCIIFPKGKTTWEGFQRPFKDGDIVSVATYPVPWIGIFKRYGEASFESHCCLNAIGDFCNTSLKNHSLIGLRLATEEEKQKLFDIIKANGYHWNSETKTLDRLVNPMRKFKIGDTIRHKQNGNPFTITKITDDCYWGGYRYCILIEQQDNFELFKIEFKVGDAIQNKETKKRRTITKIHKDCYECDDRYVLTFENQDDWELVPNKFDINTLIPFESRVLVRPNRDSKWCGSFFSHIDEDFRLHDNKFVTTAVKNYPMCIPYEGNEHLLGTTNDCDDFYKTWK